MSVMTITGTSHHHNYALYTKLSTAFVDN